MAEDEREPVSYERAVEMIGDGELIHTIRNSAAGLLLGADWDRADLLKAIAKHGAELSGPSASAMNHGLLLIDDHGPLFIETLGAPECLSISDVTQQRQAS